MVCRTMELRFFKLGIVLTYAFNLLKASQIENTCAGVYGKCVLLQNQIFKGLILSVRLKLERWKEHNKIAYFCP